MTFKVKMEEEAVGWPEGVGGEGGDDSDDLEGRGAVLAGDTLVNVHCLEQLQQHPWCDSSHGYRNSETMEGKRKGSR